MSKLLQGTLFGISQVLLFIIVYEGFWRIATLIFGPFRNDLSWGLTVRYSVIIVIVVVFVINLFIVLCSQQKWNGSVIVLGLLSFVSLNIDSLTHTPYRFILLLVAAIISMTPSILLIKRQKKSD